MPTNTNQNVPSAPRPDEIVHLFEITKALSFSPDLEESLSQVLEILSENLGMTHGAITVLHPRTGELSIEVALGLTDEAKRRGKYHLGEGVTGRVVATGQPAVIKNIGQEPEFLNRTRSRGDLAKSRIAFLCVPLMAGAGVMGALSVDRPFDDEVLLDEDLRLLTIIAGLIGQTVERLRAFQAERDELLDDNLHLRHKLADRYRVANIIGKSSRMNEVFEMIDRVARSKATVLLRGGSGTGKELVANAIHFNSARAEEAMVKVNCTALPEGLIESELFGHEKGAFTGAVGAKRGLVAEADGGTLFLDEVGDLPPDLQAKLLRLLQEKEYRRVGGNRVYPADVRIIAATHQDLEDLLTERLFREDLYYRLNVFPIYLPPLRERRTDVMLLAEHFLERYTRENGKSIRRVSTPAIDLLTQYHWPGNVRELQNVIERAVLVCDEDVIKSYHLPPSLQTGESSDTSNHLSLVAATEQFEREMIVDALKQSGGVRARAAKLLSTSNRIINYKIGKFGIDPGLYRQR